MSILLDNQIIKELTTTAFIVAGIVWLAKNVFKQILSRDIESFKNNLEKESIQFKIRYEKIQGERLTIIKKFYYKLVDVEMYTRSLTSPMQFNGELPLEDKKKVAGNKFNKCREYFDKNKIFFDEKLADKIDELLNLYKKILIDMDLSLWYKKDGARKEHTDEWLKAYNKISKEVPSAKELIENKFRKLLGIENE